MKKNYLHKVLLPFLSGTIFLCFLLTTALVNAAELLIVEEHYCPYCERFNAEIGNIYPKTTEGKQAPLVRIQLEDPWPEKYSGIKKASVTPTFILVHEGKEIDRMLGYQGDEFFWFLLGNMLEKLPKE